MHLAPAGGLCDACHVPLRAGGSGIGDDGVCCRAVRPGGGSVLEGCAVTAVSARPDIPPLAQPAGLAGPAGGRLLVVAMFGAAVAVLLGLFSGPLWLDEAQSVAIARLPLEQLPQALREDGAPPLYYLLLHGWTALLGTAEPVVRLPSALLLVAAAPLAHAFGRRVLGPTGGRVALLVLLALPWTLRYAAETRMYLLVLVLVLAGALGVLALRDRAGWGPFAVVAGSTGALLYTHYWSLLLLAVVGLRLLPGLWRREAVALRTTAALVVGGLCFLPWLPVFLYQAANTAAPWARPPGLRQLLRSPEIWSAGPAVPRIAFALALVALVVLALRAARRTGSSAAPTLAVLTFAPLLVAFVGAALGGGAYVGRYTAVVVPFLVLLLAAGLLALPAQRQVQGGTAFVLAGLVLGGMQTAELRTQGGEVARAVEQTGRPGDVVVVCPDQLGPSVARELAPEFTLLAYPTLGPAERVDWVGYEARQDAVVPEALAARLDELAGNAQIFVDFAPAYLTFGQDCQRLVSTLSGLRGAPTIELQRRLAVDEEHRLYRFGGR